MADYDCIVAFDPDWKALKPEQVDLLFDWVDQDHGGMIVVAGPVNAGRAAEGWVQDPDMAKIRRLYPVEFNQGLDTRSNVTYSSEEPWPLEFTREGLQAAYLWLGDSAIASQATWAQFSGVYSFCPVRDKKAGATVLARFGDSRAAQGGQQPIYMAVHRYSASPVLYLGSAETWRLRRVDPALFDQFWTKTIRFVAQEHLRRQSSRGSLSIDRDRYNVGTSVEVRAQLKNSRLQPLTSPSVTLYVTRDGLDRQAVSMPADPSRLGRFIVELPVLRPGEYNLELIVPETGGRAAAPDFPRRGAQAGRGESAAQRGLAAGNCREDAGRILRRPVGGPERHGLALAGRSAEGCQPHGVDSAGPQAGRRRKMAEMDVGRPVLRFESGVAGSAFGETGLIVDNELMATLEHESSPPLPPAIRQQLDALRAGIRRYVWLEGLAAMAVWLGAAFWGSMAIDWIFEPPRPLRGAVLAAAGIGLAVVLFRFILRRAFVRLSNRNMATILERQFPQLNDSLLTSVSLLDRPIGPSGFNPQMLAHTSNLARQRLDDVPLSQVFNPMPLVRKVVIALGLALAIGLLAVMAPAVLSLWAERNLLLADTTVAAQDPPGGGGLYRRRGQGGRRREFRSPRAGLPRRYRNTRHSRTRSRSAIATKAAAATGRP